MKFDYKASELKILLDPSLAPAAFQSVYALNLIDAAGLDSAFVYGSGFWSFDPTKIHGTVLGSMTGAVRDTYVKDNDLYMAIYAFSLPISTAGIVTHVLLGKTVPILLEIGTDINILNPGASMQVGSYLACGRVDLKIFEGE